MRQALKSAAICTCCRMAPAPRRRAAAVIVDEVIVSACAIRFAASFIDRRAMDPRREDVQHQHDAVRRRGAQHMTVNGSLRTFCNVWLPVSLRPFEAAARRSRSGRFRHPRSFVPGMLAESCFSTSSTTWTSTSAHKRSSASARSVSAATSGTDSAAGSMGASSLITRTNVSSCAWLAAPLRSASNMHAANSTNSPGVADCSSTHGEPGAVRPNQRRRLPMRA